MAKPINIPLVLRRIGPYGFLAPSLILFTIVFLYPATYAFVLSFFKWTLITYKYGVPWVGLENYIRALTDPSFWNSLKVTVLFTVASITIELLIAFPLAIAFSQRFRGKWIFLSLYLLPFFCSDVVVGLTFRMLLNYEFGPINQLLAMIGFNKVLWLANPKIALFSVLMVEVWQMTPFAVLFLTAGIQSLPTYPFEAAKIDGANQLQSFFYIMFPMLRPVLLVILLFRSINLIKIFDIVFILTGGGPAGATDVLSIYINRQSFAFFNMGYSSAVSVIMIGILLVYSLVLNKMMGR